MLLVLHLFEKPRPRESHLLTGVSGERRTFEQTKKLMHLKKNWKGLKMLSGSRNFFALEGSFDNVMATLVTRESLLSNSMILALLYPKMPLILRVEPYLRRILLLF